MSTTTNNIAQRLRNSFKDKKFKEKIAKYRKLTNAGQFHSDEIASELDDYTLEKIKASGFKVENVVLYGYCNAYKISWHE